MAVETAEHGTSARYRKGCRCDACREWKSESQKAYRRNRAAREGKSSPRTKAVPRTRSVPTRGPTEEQDFGPIEQATRAALAEVGGESPIAAMRRAVAYRAAAVMDAHAPYFKSASEVLVAAVDSLLAESPAEDGESDALKHLMESFGPRGRARGGAPVGDAEESE